MVAMRKPNQKTFLLEEKNEMIAFFSLSIVKLKIKKEKVKSMISFRAYGRDLQLFTFKFLLFTLDRQYHQTVSEDMPEPFFYLFPSLCQGRTKAFAKGYLPLSDYIHQPCLRHLDE